MSLEPPDFVTKSLLALRQGKFTEAREHIRTHKAPGQPREAQHYLIEGLASLALADWTAALEIFSAATEVFPDNPQFWFNRGLAEENLRQLAEAETSYQRSLSLKPDQGEAFGNLSNIYRKLGRFPEAVQMACRALAAGVPKAHALNILGLALDKQGNFAEAQKAFDEGIALAPHDAALLANRANLAADQFRFEEAWKFFAEARSLDDLPSIRRDEGMARLLAGDYARGLPLYEARLELPDALRFQPTCSRWQGESLAGKTLLLLSEQGYGDTIQFSRYAQPLADAGANLVWLVRQPLHKLLAANLPGRVFAEDQITFSRDGILPLPRAGGARGGLDMQGISDGSDVKNRHSEGKQPPRPPSIPPASEGEVIGADFWLPVLSLPFALCMTGPVPGATFRAPNAPKLPSANGKRKIGLVWKGSTTHGRDHERSIPLTALAPLWTKIDVQFYAPFHEAGPELAKDATPIAALDHLINDFADMAALLAQMDCVITVDTAAAHLAGALGVPTYLLLQWNPDWRWGASGDTTGWYPRMKLLRQPDYGDWDSVIEKLLAELI